MPNDKLLQPFVVKRFTPFQHVKRMSIYIVVKSGVKYASLMTHQKQNQG